MQLKYLFGVITVQDRADDWIAFLTNSQAQWASGRSADAAVGNLLRTYPNAVRDTILMRGTR